MAKQSNYETEVKLYVHDLNAVARQLEAVGAVLTAPRVLETNVRYDNAAGGFNESGTVLRLRQDSRARLTYKDGERVAGEFGSTRFEAEVEVSDFETMEIILSCLGYYPAWRYEKFRTTYELDDCEIVLDELPFGDFIEIEGEDAAIGQMIAKLELGYAPRFTSSYSTLFKTVRSRLDLPFDDLTFINFEGLEVPFSALQTR